MKKRPWWLQLGGQPPPGHFTSNARIGAIVVLVPLAIAGAITGRWVAVVVAAALLLVRWSYGAKETVARLCASAYRHFGAASH